MANEDTNYDQWRRNFMFLIKFKKCEKVLENATKPDKIQQEEWDSWTNRAMYYFSIAVPTDDIMNCKNPKEVIDRLDSLHMKKSKSRQLLIEKQLNELKLGEDDDPEKFYELFERKINELKAAGGDTDEDRKLSFLMMCLPASCQNLIDVIDLIPDGQNKCDFIREKLASRKKNESSNKPKNDVKNEISNAFKASVKIKDEGNKNFVCYGCGKSGHIRRNCYSNYQSYGGNSCGNSYQGYRGHNHERRNGNNGGFRGNSNRGGNYNRGSRGRYRGFHQNPTNQNQVNFAESQSGNGNCNDNLNV